MRKTTERGPGAIGGSESCSIRSSVGSSESILRDSQHGSASAGILPSRALRRDSTSAFSLRMQSEFTVNKLRISTLSLYGREDETDKILSVLERVITNKRICKDDEDKAAGKAHQAPLKRELIWVKGNSGCGKTRLVDDVLHNASKRKGALYIRGEFDLNNQQGDYVKPYSAFASACETLHEKLLTESALPNGFDQFPSHIHRIQQKMPADQLRILGRVFPALARMNGDAENEDGSAETDQAEAQESSSFGHAEAKIRFHLAFRLYLRIVGSFFPCLVLVLDDLQWADEGSIELFRLLMTDYNNKSLLLVGCYRTEEVEQNLFTQALINDEEACSGINVTNITVGNFDLKDVNIVLMDLVGVAEESETSGLALICHKKTMGNPFFVKMFLLMLEQQQLLHFNLGLMKWIWNEEEIDEETQITDNVVDLMTTSMQGLQAHVQEFLKIAACLGNPFPRSLLNKIWKKLRRGHDNTVQSSLEDSILTSVKEGFIEQTGADEYKFSHDKVQEAALSLIAENGVVGLKRQLGEILVATLDQDDLIANIFTTVNLLNQSEQKSMAQAQLNLSAATEAVKLSAIKSAAKYAVKGIQCLPENYWTDQRELSFQLYSIAAETEGYLGQTVPMKEHCEAVLSQECNMLDKVRVYNALLDSYANQGKFLDAHSMCENVLAELGCKFAKSKIIRTVRTLNGLRRLRRTAKYRSASKLSSMPMMEDRARVETMRLMEKLVTYCYLTADWALYILVVLREVEWTDRYGLSESAAHAFGTAGLIFSALLGEYETGSIYGEHALRVLDKIKFGRLEAQSKFVVYSFVLHWTKSSHLMDRQLFDAYEAAMRAGDIEYAMYSIHTFLISALQSGRLLELLEADCRNYTRIMVEHKRFHTLIVCSQIWQLILNLMGRCERRLVLSGEALDKEKLQSNADIHLNLLRANYQILYAIYGNHEVGAKLAVADSGKLAATVPGSALVVMDHFYQGVSCFAMAQRSRKRVFLRHGIKLLASLSDWARRGNPNVVHCKTLLEAERAVYKRETKKAKTLFETATSLARGRVHDAALTHERYAVFLLECGDQTDAKFQLEQAAGLYRDWGAKGKLASLRENYADILDFARGRDGPLQRSSEL